MSKHETEILLTISGEESVIDVTVMYDHIPAEKGRWECGQQMEPDYPESIDVWEVYGSYDREADRLYIMKWLSKEQVRGLELDILETYRD